VNKEEQKHIEATVGNFMVDLCDHLENVWRDDAGQQLCQLVFNGHKKYKDQYIEPLHIIIEAVIKFYQQKMVEYLEMLGEERIEEIPEKFKYITDRDHVEQRLFNYFIDTDEKGKVTKKKPLFHKLLSVKHTEGGIH